MTTTIGADMPARSTRAATGQPQDGKSPGSPATGDVEAAVRRDIEAVAALDPSLASSGLAALAVALAREIDGSSGSTTAMSNCARSLLDAMIQLRALAPDQHKESPLDEIRARREKRIADSDRGVGARRDGAS